MEDFHIIIRFYEELNDFLTPPGKKEDISFVYKGKRSVKDLIESFGVPHVEVDLIMANGEPVDFDYAVRDGDRLSVYPVFERLNIGGISGLRERPLRDSRFVLDVHLGKLARDLRMLGFDCLWNPDWDDPDLACISAEEQRILLTRDRGLLKRKIVSRGLAVRSDDPETQLKEVMEKLDLKDRIEPFTRCLSCNGRIGRLEPGSPLFEKLKPCIPPKVLEVNREFSWCPVCGKVYWKGSHYDSMMRRIEKM